MRGVLLIALVGCGFDAGTSAPGDGSAPVDAPPGTVDPDAAPNAIPDAAPDGGTPPRSCGAAYVALPAAGTSSTYRKVNTSNSWPNARGICAADDAYLVIPETPTEALAVGAFVAPRAGSPYYWAGISRVNTTWTTVLGAAFANPPWGTDQPNQRQGEIYVLVQASNGTFWDYFDNGSQEFACECAP